MKSAPAQRAYQAAVLLRAESKQAVKELCTGDGVPIHSFVVVLLAVNAIPSYSSYSYLNIHRCTLLST